VATRTAHRKQARRRKPLSKRVRDTYELWSRLFAEHELMTCASAISFKVIVSSVSLVLLGLGVLGKLGREDVWRDRIAPHIQDRVLPDVYKGITRRSSGPSTSSSETR
jgi:uncharacterized BrkB/YihY/UPF0761 family membrane protein